MFLLVERKQLWKQIEILRISIEKRVREFGAQYQAFSIFGILNYPLFYFVWKYYDRTGYESFSLRLTATILSIILLLRNYWPKQLKPWLPIYWYITLFFCLPFFFFFMLFMNNGNSLWLMTANTILFWLGFMVEPTSYLFILCGGIFFAWVTFLLAHPNFTFSFEKWWGIGLEFIASFIVAAFFAGKKHRFTEEKLDTMLSLGASLAHEIRTPLASIHANVVGVKNYWDELLSAYKIAKAASLPVPSIRTSQFDLLEKSFSRIQREVDFANLVINMLLANVDLGKLRNIPLEKCSIRECIHQALDRYPFVDNERNLIQWEDNQDFHFKGKELLVIHVLFNLIKNSLYHIKAANKGGIRIFLGSTQQYNQVHFLDTGAGISAQTLSRIFEPFFSAARHGSGIGLTFCREVMRLFDGVISCQSVEGKHTEFILSFPKVEICEAIQKCDK